MSMLLSITTTKHVWEYYVKLPDFKARCMFCESLYNYVSTTNFQTHIARHHRDIWKYEEERKLIKWPWICFKYLNEIYSQCVICDETVLSTIESVENHLSSHSVQQRRNYICRGWPWKYWTKKDDFAVECNICYKSVPLSLHNQLDYHIEMIHSDKLKKTQGTNDAVSSLERVSSLQIETSTSRITITKQHLWKYYVKLPDFKAQCKFCGNQYFYLDISKFLKHIRILHETVFKYEKERELRWPWMYFKYFDNIYSQCIICDANVPSTNESVEKHLALHSAQQRENNKCKNWRKYYTQRDDFTVECNICHKNILLDIRSYLNSHTKMTHLNKLKNTQEAHDTADSSDCVSLLQMHRTSMSLTTIVTKKHLWKYYVKLPNLKAQCKFCDNIYIYANIGSFKSHIKIQHGAIWKYEEEKKLTKWPWMHFKYLDNIYLQCIICDVNVPSTIESVKNHLSSHSMQQKKDYKYGNWLFKYFTQKDTFMVECNICHNNVSLYIRNSPDYHIRKAHSDKLENTEENVDEIDNTVDLLKHESLFQTETASKSQIIVTKEHTSKYYVMLPDFKIQCKFCEKKCSYPGTGVFRTHIRSQHTKIWKYEEERKLTPLPWIYFKYLDNTYLQCVICATNVRSIADCAKIHLSLHSEKQRDNYLYPNWTCKYWTKKNDYVVECNVCHKNLSIFFSANLDYHIRKKHSDKLETAPSVSPTIAAHNQHLWKYYVKLPDFKAQCKFCKNNFDYIRINNVQQHINRQHNSIRKYEEEREKTKWPWMHFKYFDKIYAQCIICDANVPSTIESVENHLYEHSEEQLGNITYTNWLWKYCTVQDDFVKCNVCHKNFYPFFHNKLNFHITMKHLDKLNNTNEADVTVDSSKCVSSFETDKTPMPQPIVNKNCLWKYYINFSESEAQCKYCEKKYNYIEMHNFCKHIKRQHDTIWKYERERKLIKWPWMHFKYLDNIYLQCIICDANVPAAIEAVENHLTLHSLEQMKNNIYREWLWKYCTKKDDFVVECSICRVNIMLSFSNYLDYHIKVTHLDKLKDAQETHDTAGLAERISSLNSDTTAKLILSLKDCYVLLTKCPHSNFYK